jgi:hypothetical protein
MDGRVGGLEGEQSSAMQSNENEKEKARAKPETAGKFERANSGRQHIDETHLKEF